MELYRMKQGAAVSAQIVYLEEAKYAYSLTEDNYKKMPENSAGYYEYKKNVLIPDIMQNPTYMVSDIIQKVIGIYDSTISCKDIFIMPNDEKYLNKGVQMFHIPDLPRVDCMAQQAVILPNGGVQDVILNSTKVQNKDIFLVDHMAENIVIVSLRFMESVLRRGPLGVEFQRVECVEEK